jgi:hypothetical protein
MDGERVTMVVPVFTTSCQVFEKPKKGGQG